MSFFPLLMPLELLKMILQEERLTLNPLLLLDVLVLLDLDLLHNFITELSRTPTFLLGLTAIILNSEGLALSVLWHNNLCHLALVGRLVLLSHIVTKLSFIVCICLLKH